MDRVMGPQVMAFNVLCPCSSAHSAICSTHCSKVRQRPGAVCRYSMPSASLDVARFIDQHNVLADIRPLTHGATLSSASIQRQFKTVEWIHWDNVLATGHVILDTDHEHLVALFDQLVSSVKERKGKVACAELLYKVIQHAQVHFAFEEQLTADHHCPKADQHTTEHARLVKQAVR